MTTPPGRGQPTDRDQDPGENVADPSPPPPVVKGKKRVGFIGSNLHPGDDDDAYDFSYSPRSAHSPASLLRDAPYGPDASELRARLTKVLSNEATGQRPGSQSPTPREGDLDSPDPEPHNLPASGSRPVTPRLPGDLSAADALRLPRPALRTRSSYNSPGDHAVAEWAAQRVTQRQAESQAAAKYRADSLAKSMHSPDASRSSMELHSPADTLTDVGSVDGFSSSHSLRPLVDGEEESGVRRRYGGDPRQPTGAVEEAEAERLVRTHTGRRPRPMVLDDPTASGNSSGTSTPSQYVQDYVPRPGAYKGGILASLLKLYNQPSPGSGASTPQTPGSPHLSPSTSRPQSGTLTPVSGSARPTIGFPGHHGRSPSSSSHTFAGLMGSASLFAAPASADISGKLHERLKHESAGRKTKKQREQHRITVHIADIISRHRYLLRLCRALILYGAPTHRLEEYLRMSARVLEIEGQFLYFPGCMIISFDDRTTHTTEFKIVRAPQGVDLGRLRDVHSIYKDVIHDVMDAREASELLDEILKRKPRYSRLTRVLLYGAASAFVAPFAFQGRLIDMPIAFLLGCIVGYLQLIAAPNNELYANLFEVTAALITTLLARAFGSIRGGNLFCFSALAQSSIALILPGYMVLCSSLELQSRNMVSGSVRMVYALVYTIFLGYGITIGASLYGMIDKNASSATSCEAPLPQHWYVLFVSGFTLCLCIINQARFSQVPVMLVMAIAGFIASSYSAKLVGGNAQVSSMLGALAVGTLANLYARTGPHLERIWIRSVAWFDRRFYRRSKHWFGRFRRVARDPESDAGSDAAEVEKGDDERDGTVLGHRLGYGLAAATMLPALFVQVPSGLAVSGSLLAGVTSANQITGNTTGDAVPSSADGGISLDGTPFTVLFAVIQVAIGISVGLFLSTVAIYPFGKRRSGLFSF